ncbi:MAG: hypothetical protein R3264_18515, partial [Anaerolineae bacterium]|nr:hypothetical protein [Anaerolineae bacterium]
MTTAPEDERWRPNPWLWLALALILISQLVYLPDRLAFWHYLYDLTTAETITDRYRLAYGAADYDFLVWVEQQTPPTSTILLVTAGDRTYGDPTYVLYHRALYHLAPRTVWWAAPVEPTRYPVWWLTTDLSADSILTLAQARRADVIIAEGFEHAPLLAANNRQFKAIAYDANTHLIFLGDGLAPVAAVPATTPFFQDCGIAGIVCRATIWLKLAGAILLILLWGDLLPLSLRGQRRIAP